MDHIYLYINHMKVFAHTHIHIQSTIYIHTHSYMDIYKTCRTIIVVLLASFRQLYIDNHTYPYIYIRLLYLIIPVALSSGNNDSFPFCRHPRPHKTRSPAQIASTREAHVSCGCTDHVRDALAKYRFQNDGYEYRHMQEHSLGTCKYYVYIYICTCIRTSGRAIGRSDVRIQPQLITYIDVFLA